MPEAVAEPFIEPFGVGRGWQEVVRVPSPGAGVGWSYKIAGQYITRPVIVTFALTTAGGGSGRVPLVEYQDTDGNVLGFGVGSHAVAGGGGALVSFAVGAQPAADPAVSHTLDPLPDVFLEPGRVIVASVANMAGGDSISGIFLTLDRLPTGQPAGRRRRRLPPIVG